MERMITKHDWKNFHLSGGLTITGIPLVVSSLLIYLVKRERDRVDGLIIYEKWKKDATLFLDTCNNKAYYYCHPDEVENLISRVRRN